MCGDLLAERIHDFIEELAKRVGRVFATTDARAAVIARTEVADAFNFGNIKEFAKSGIVSKVDVSDVGGPGDPGCVNANGQQWDLETALSNKLEHPNCVRTFRPVVSRR